MFLNYNNGGHLYRKTRDNRLSYMPLCVASSVCRWRILRCFTVHSRQKWECSHLLCCNNYKDCPECRAGARTQHLPLNVHKGLNMEGGYQDNSERSTQDKSQRSAKEGKKYSVQPRLLQFSAGESGAFISASWDTKSCVKKFFN